ncbi:uncharacterized protein B0I36DRAFT_328996 [Microdochium trichocladiopsis]|uniref:Essential protein Yae1 N-terminal domain-containing protein n=1 Tax=Microdochium trichocladiopsis TaxID=1682393 RepID=A0A9P8XZ01_9PEZI|nr:uncharacterized protein B0I36DRAFT_328996 [Microdochium trichocladiopsis]KAH7025727.1 hypothetical protein B0I36DRAFT_328996 [Microdochium trichocladiopsis]
MPTTNDDLFDDVLNLEEQYYQEGYTEGLRDGVEAGKIEGRSVGLKSGFEKFLEAGRLQGRALVWANRLPSLTGGARGGDNSNASHAAASSSDATTSPETTPSLPSLPSPNARLEKNVVTLYGLLEPGTLSTQNDDAAVNDFDSRLKGAQGKAKIIDRAIGEKIPVAEPAPGSASASASSLSAAKEPSIEDVGRIRP